jgi:hypothetical protein
LQEKLVLLGSNEVFKAVPSLLESILGIKVSESQVYRVCQASSANLPQSVLNAPSVGLRHLQNQEQEQVYGMVDGSMLFTDAGWQESKVGRVFKAEPLENEGNKRSWQLTHSEYVAKRGSYEDFTVEFERLLPPLSPCRKVFITDGALWIGQWLKKSYPEAIHILDFYHVCEKLAALSPWATEQQWLDKMKNHLLTGQQLKVRQSVWNMKTAPLGARNKLLNYLENNAYRMHYDQYRAQGLMIGSGPIESAHRTLLQVRMKRSGQRWSDQGCDSMIKLRVALLSNKANLINDIFRKNAA